MHGFFAADHVAVFGVSTREGNLGQRIVSNLLKFAYRGRISLIGRSGGALAGHPIVPSLAECRGQVDLAVVLTPAQTIPDIFRECAAHGVKRIIVESGGFNELGAPGAQLAEEIKRSAAENDIRFIGPNGIGVVDRRSGLAVPFPVMPMPPLGPVSIITQSGGVGLLYANHLEEEGIGMSRFASMGNKLDVDENDLIPAMAGDDATRLILAYLESIPDGRRLFETLRACPKPVVVHKANTSAASAGIAGSHTAALMNDDAVVTAALRQAGAVRAEKFGDTVNAIKAFLLPPMRGNEVVVVSRSGGHAIIAADKCAEAGMRFARLPQSFYEDVRRHVRADVIKLSNPLDLGDLFEIEAYLHIMDSVMAQPQVDAVIFLFVYLSAYDPRVPERIVDRARQLTEKYDRPMALVLYTWPHELTRMKKYTQFPIFETAEEAVAALAARRDHHRFRQAAPRRTPRVKLAAAAEALLADKPRGAFLRQDECFALADCYGLPHPPLAFAANEKQAVAAAAAWGDAPVAVKVESPAATHKTDVEGILLNKRGAKEIRAAFRQLKENLARHLPDATFAGALLMPMAAPGLEFIAGAKRDPSFGPVVLLGWGGTAAEAMEKVSLRLAPLMLTEARQMIDELPGQKLLDGFRGRPGVDRKALAQLLVRLGELAQHPTIAEIDLNPVRAYPDRVLLLDARVRLR